MAIKLMQNGIDAMQAIGAEIGRPYFLSLLAEGFGEAGYIEDGLEVLETALDKARVNEEHWYDSGLYWLLGRLSEAQGSSKTETTARYWQAIEIAGIQEAKTLELRGAIGLMKFGEGRDLLRETYQWFKEGLDSDFLVEARSLIDKDK